MLRLKGFLYPPKILSPFNLFIIIGDTMLNKNFGKIIDIKSKYPHDIPNKIYECFLCGYTSDDSANFDNDICLMCLRMHDMDY